LGFCIIKEELCIWNQCNNRNELVYGLCFKWRTNTKWSCLDIWPIKAWSLCQSQPGTAEIIYSDPKKFLLYILCSVWIMRSYDSRWSIINTLHVGKGHWNWQWSCIWNMEQHLLNWKQRRHQYPQDNPGCATQKLMNGGIEWRKIPNRCLSCENPKALLNFDQLGVQPYK